MQIEEGSVRNFGKQRRVAGPSEISIMNDPPPEPQTTVLDGEANSPTAVEAPQTADPRTSATLQLHNCKYYHLPAETRQPLEYRLADCVLGHVRLDPATDGCTKVVVKRLEDKCGNKFLSRLRVETRDDGERVAKDRTDLIALHDQ